MAGHAQPNIYDHDTRGNMSKLMTAVFLTLLVVGCGKAPAPATPPEAQQIPDPSQIAKPEEVHVIMFYVTVDREDGHYTHAQVVGGYKDHESCQRAVPAVGAATAADLAPTDIPIFLCPEINVEGIKREQGEATKRPDDAPPLEDRLRAPSNKL